MTDIIFWHLEKMRARFGAWFVSTNGKSIKLRTEYDPMFYRPEQTYWQQWLGFLPGCSGSRKNSQLLGADCFIG